MAARRTLISLTVAVTMAASSFVPAAAQTAVVAPGDLGPRTLAFYDSAREMLDVLTIPASLFVGEGTLAEGVNALCHMFVPNISVAQSECLRIGADWAGQYELAAYALAQARAALEAGNAAGEEVWYLFAQEAFARFGEMTFRFQETFLPGPKTEMADA